MRFTDAAGNLNGLTADRFIFYSDSEGGVGDLADVGLPAKLSDNAFNVSETLISATFAGGPEGTTIPDGFTWTFTDKYTAISDGTTPEPPSAVLMATVLTGFLVQVLRRKMQLSLLGSQAAYSAEVGH